MGLEATFLWSPPEPRYEGQPVGDAGHGSIATWRETQSLGESLGRACGCQQVAGVRLPLQAQAPQFQSNATMPAALHFAEAVELRATSARDAHILLRGSQGLADPFGCTPGSTSTHRRCSSHPLRTVALLSGHTYSATAPQRRLDNVNLQADHQRFCSFEGSRQGSRTSCGSQRSGSTAGYQAEQRDEKVERVDLFEMEFTSSHRLNTNEEEMFWGRAEDLGTGVPCWQKWRERRREVKKENM